MNKEAVLTFIKKNVLSLSCALVAILAVAATFYPLGDMVTQLQTDAAAVAADYTTLQSATTKKRTLPTTDPTKTEPGQLIGFPNAATVTWGKEENEKFIKASQTVLQTVQEMSARGHDPVVPGAFSPTRTDSVLFAFAKTYALILSTDPNISGVGDPSATPALVADPTLKASGQTNIQNDILHGCLPPTPDDILQAGNTLKTEKYVPLVILKNGVPVNQTELDAQWRAECATLGLKMKRGAAQRHKIYVDKDAFTVNPAIPPHDPPKVEDMWYAQMQVWMQRDLASAITEENSKSGSILDSPVKRLLKLDVPAATMYVFAPASGAAAQPAGVPAISKDTDPVTINYAISPTGRSSNGMYDVLQFGMVVDVDASKVNEFIETLSHQRLITVNIQNEFALDSEVESRNGFLYGSKPTVRLVLDGEMLFMRSWTFDLMPERVKQALGLIPGGTPGVGMPGGMPGPGPGPGFSGGPGSFGAPPR